MKMIMMTLAIVMTTLFAMGQGPAKKVVTLTWNASNSPGVQYRVYRSKTAGGPYNLITPQNIVGLTCDDPNVARGDTLFYVATAVDSTGDESVNSNETKAVVPQPLGPPQGMGSSVH